MKPLLQVTCVAGIVAVRDRPSMKFKLYVLEDGSAGRLSMVLSRSLRSEIDPLLEGALKYVGTGVTQEALH
jgi:hypothetical protein